MDFLKKVNAFILGLVVLLAFGCGGDEPEPDNSLNSSQASFTNCKVKKATYTGGIEVIYHYDNLGILSEISSVTPDWHAVNVFNTIGKLAKATYFYGTDTSSYTFYEYNSDSLLIKKMGYEAKNPQTKSIITYEYDSQKRLVHSYTHVPGQPGVIKYKYNFAYLPGNKVVVECWRMEDALNPNWVKAEEQEIVFDNMKNPFGDYPHNIVGNEAIDLSSIDHNIISYIVHDFPNGISRLARSITIKHAYNSAGYPIETTEMNSYGIPTNHVNYEYGCQ